MWGAIVLQQLCHWHCAGVYALQEITAILDPKLATHKMGRDIMDKLQSYSKKAPTPCNGLKMEIEANPMTPIKSIRWRRSSVAESGADINSSDAEDVPYVMLYFTVSGIHTASSAGLVLHKAFTLELAAQQPFFTSAYSRELLYRICSSPMHALGLTAQDFSAAFLIHPAMLY